MLWCTWCHTIMILVVHGSCVILMILAVTVILKLGNNRLVSSHLYN